MPGSNLALAPLVPAWSGRPGSWLRGRAAQAGDERVHAWRWAILAAPCLSVFVALVFAFWDTALQAQQAGLA
jgi:hypothetical protein